MIRDDGERRLHHAEAGDGAGDIGLGIVHHDAVPQFHDPALAIVEEMEIHCPASSAGQEKHAVMPPKSSIACGVPFFRKYSGDAQVAMVTRPTNRLIKLLTGKSPIRRTQSIPSSTRSAGTSLTPMTI